MEINAGNLAVAGESKKKSFQMQLTAGSSVFMLKTTTEADRESWLAAFQLCGNRRVGGAVAELDLGGDAGAGSAALVGGIAELDLGSGDGDGPPPPPVPATTLRPPLPPIPVSAAAAANGGPHSPRPSPRPSRTARPLPPPPAPPAASGGGGAAAVATVGAPPVEQHFVVPTADPSDPFAHERWHFGRSTRVTAEKVLARHGSNGSFLLRASESSRGDFSLSVQDDGMTKHYKVTMQSEGVLTLTGHADRSFADLGELVQYYCTASKGRSHPLDKKIVEAMDKAFCSPAVVVPGAMLPGQLIAMETERQYKSSPRLNPRISKN